MFSSLKTSISVKIDGWKMKNGGVDHDPMIHQKASRSLRFFAGEFLTPRALVPGKGGVVSLRALESRNGSKTAWFQGLSSRLNLALVHFVLADLEKLLMLISKDVFF